MKIDLCNVTIEAIPDDEGGGYSATHKLDKMRGDGNTVTEAIENLLEVLIVRNNGK